MIKSLKCEKRSREIRARLPGAFHCDSGPNRRQHHRCNEAGDSAARSMCHAPGRVPSAHGRDSQVVRCQRRRTCERLPQQASSHHTQHFQGLYAVLVAAVSEVDVHEAALLQQVDGILHANQSLPLPSSAAASHEPQRAAQEGGWMDIRANWALAVQLRCQQLRSQLLDQVVGQVCID